MMPSGLGFRFTAAAALVLVQASASVLAQAIAPPPPKEYNVQIRYRIRAGLNQRVPQFFAMLRYLESLGFQKRPGPENEPEDFELTRMYGTIPSHQALRILSERHVQAILLMPADYELPKAADQRVKVQIGLESSLPPDRRRLLAEQVVSFLQDVGFQNGVAYDHRGYLRLVGSIPAGNVGMLLEDLRWQSTGWMAPRIPVTSLPSPIKYGWPVRWAEIVPEPAGLAPIRRPTAPARAPGGLEYLQKVTRDLRGMTTVAEPMRLEVILSATPLEHERGWELALIGAAPGLQIEGRIGEVVTIVARPNQVPNLAALPGVSTVRLPRPATHQPAPAPEALSNSEALRSGGLARLHAQGHRGKGVRVAVVDDDFRSYEGFLGNKLPAATRLIDISSACDPELRPTRPSGGAGNIGHGTQCALAVALAAPDAELTLIRVDRSAPYQVLAVARHIRGEAPRSYCLERRSTEFVAEEHRLEAERDKLAEERRAILEDFSQDEASVKRREAHQKKLESLESEEGALRQRQRRYVTLLRDLAGLRGISVVCSGLNWDEGYPADGTSPLSRYFEDQPARCMLWLQAAGNTAGQAWSGVFRDVDDNGVMEFAAPAAPLPAGRWTPELNFLRWQTLDGLSTPDLPKVPVRISLQWREPHDPTFFSVRGDPYRQPLATVRMMVLLQRDPSGIKLGSDDMEVVAQSTDWPQRLENQPTFAVYEQTLEFNLPVTGRYALRIEGRLPRSVRPADEPTLPNQEVHWELHPRIFMTVADEALRSQGRLTFADFIPGTGNLGMPADSRGLFTVGAIDRFGKVEPFSALGPAVGEGLSGKPELFALGALPAGVLVSSTSAGTRLSAGIAAGWVACELSASGSANQVFSALNSLPGKRLDGTNQP
jgi:hypothetical protein